MADTPDWVRAIEADGGNVTVNVDTAGGPVETTINTAGGPVQTEVTNNTINVQTVSGSTVQVANTITADINSSVTIDTNTVNDYVASNPLVYFDVLTVTISDLASGAVQLENIIGPIGVYDGALLYAFSEGALIRDYAFQFNALYMHNEPGVTTRDCQTYAPIAAETMTITGYDTDGGLHGAVTGITAFPGTAFSLFQVLVKNVSGGAIVSDTLQVLLMVRNAESNVINTSSNPVQQQTAQVTGGAAQAGFINTDGSQGTIPGNFYGITSGNPQYLSEWGIYYRNTGSGAQTITVRETSSGLNIFQDNVPAGQVLSHRMPMQNGASIGALEVMYSVASSGIINFWSNDLTYPQNHVPTVVS